jgi:hypothetical protein
MEGTLDLGGTKPSMGNVFNAETGLLRALKQDRVSGKAESKYEMAAPTRPELLKGCARAPCRRRSWPRSDAPG